MVIIPSLAVEYRPKTFDEVCGENSIIKILKRQIDLKEFKNSYLFCGPSGCGKTTTARIFANEINGHVGAPIEIDAASNNGVDNVKTLIKSAQERSINSEYKIYIIDECHSLTIQAWQAFLKCIEEPPKYTIFIFCTTDPQKVPATILNRCMRFNFSRISSKDIENRLNQICVKEGFQNYKETTEYISKICKCQMRDGISYLEKVASYDNVLSIENALQALGNFSYSIFFNLINFIIDGNESQVLSIINQFYTEGGDLKLFVDQFLTFCLDVMKYSLLHESSILQIPSSLESQLKNSTNFNDADKYYSYVIDKLLLLKNELKQDTNPKSTIEVRFLQITRCV